MPATTDSVAIAAYYDLSLTGLETVSFTDISGLTHSLNIAGAMTMTATGDPADARTIGLVDDLHLSCTHVVVTSDALWSWLDQVITTRAGTESMKSGTLSIRNLTTGTMVKTWRLDEVFIKSIGLDSIGAGNGTNHLTATVDLFVGTCVPM